MESQFYLENLISNDEHPLWAVKSESLAIRIPSSNDLIILTFGIETENKTISYFAVLDSVAKIVDGLYENSKSLCDASYFCQKYKMEGTNQELVELYERLVNDFYRYNPYIYFSMLR